MKLGALRRTSPSWQACCDLKKIFLQCSSHHGWRCCVLPRVCPVRWAAVAWASKKEEPPLTQRPLLLSISNGKVFRVIRGEAAIKHNLPPKRTTEFPQRTRIAIPI